ncbi:MAG: hypothetical protein ABSB76_24260 [Streptosporangiaceae bacterium]|jgi:hypothetical protein
MTDLLADAVAELYEADPDDFTQRRQNLVTSAREAGQPGAAKQIAGLRKPTRSAWVVNRLVRADPRVASRLAELAAELRAEPAMDGARIRELTAARGRLVDELTRQALQESDLPAPPATLREEVAATLDAAIADPEVAANLGTLVRAAHWAGFGLAPLPDGAFVPPPSPRTKTPPKTEKPPPPPPPPAPAEAARERDRRRQEKIQAAERAVAEADQAAASANAAEQDLEHTVRQLEAELADARQRLADARRQAYRAESRQRRANAELGRLRE